MQAGSGGSVCCLAFLVTLTLRVATATGPLTYGPNDLHRFVAKRSISDNNDDIMDLKSEAIQDEVERVTATEDSTSVFENESEAINTKERNGFLDLSEPTSQAEASAAVESDVTSQDVVDASNQLSTSPDGVLGGSLRRGAPLHGSGYSRRLIPKNELIYLQDVIGAEELVTCSGVGEMYSLRTPWNECLVCACQLEGGRVQPVCANCATCREDRRQVLPPALAPAFAPTVELDVMLRPSLLEPELPLIAPRPAHTLLPIEPEPIHTLLPIDPQPCAPLPYGVPFEHPLNPCQVCICRKELLKQNEVFISCMENTQCFKQLPTPTLPPSSFLAAPITTPVCNKFPVDVLFPHPTEACQLCKCLEHVHDSYSTPERQLLCVADINCGLKPPRPDVLVPETLQPSPGFLPPNEIFQPELAPSLEVDSYAIDDTPSGPNLPSPSPILPFIQENPSEFIPMQPSPNSPYPDFLPPRPPILIPNQPEPAVPFIDYPREPQLISAPIMPTVIPFQQPARPFYELLPPQPQPEILAPSLPDEIIDVEAFAENEPVRLPDHIPIPTYPSLPPEPTQLIPLPVLPEQPLPWPPVTIPAFPNKKNGPLLGPPPHQSCQPFPANIPFQHPWDTCQLCVCAEYSVPGQISIEVNCYTKPSCCVELPGLTGQYAVQGQGPVQSEVPQKTFAPIQLLDDMCELKSFGVEFPHPRDSCQVCSCRPLGVLVVPQCRRLYSPRCKLETGLVPATNVRYIEPRCQSRPPDKPFVIECSVCICQVIYTFVIAKCTPQPKCLQNLEGNLDAQASAMSGDDGGSYNPMFFNNALNGIPAVNSIPNPEYLYGQNPQRPISGYQPRPSLLPAQSANLYPMPGPNLPISFVNPASVPDMNSQLYQPYPAPAYQPGINFGPPRNTPSQISTLAFLEALKNQYQPKYRPQPYPVYPSKYSNQPDAEIAIDAQSILYPSSSNEYLMQRPINPYMNLLRPQGDNAQAFAQAQAQGQLEAQAQALAGYLRSQAAPDSPDSDNPYTTRPYDPYARNWNPKQIEATTSEALQSTQVPTRQPVTERHPWETTTLEYDREGGSRALLHALAQAGVAIPTTGAAPGTVVRTGRGLCQYAGDRYHRRCQACYCLVDTDHATSGDLYSICLGKPCH